MKVKGEDGKTYTIRLAGRVGAAREAFWAGEATAQQTLAAERTGSGYVPRYNVVVTDASGNERSESDHARLPEAMAACDAFPREKGNAAVWDRATQRWVKESEMPWAEILTYEDAR